MVTYGNGKVLFDGDADGFEIKYKGTIKITKSPDNLFIIADRRSIKGVMLDGSNLPSELFRYLGEFKLLSFMSVSSGVKQRERISLQGVDYWELDAENWEDDGSLWGTRNGTYLRGSKQIFNPHTIVVNNNLKTQYSAQFFYPNGRAVPANEPIHIHADGVVMSGGVHTKDSVVLKDAPQTKQQTSQIRRATTPATPASSGGGSSSGGGGGY